jgi:hypothetical protein
MKTFRKDHNVASWAAVHTVSTEDQIAMTAMRAAVEPSKGKLQGAGARGFFDAIMEGVAAPSGIIYEADKIGGVPGWWCRPKDARPSQAVMHIHGGWFNFGSAQSFRHLVGHIAASAGVASFLPDYALAPEHPFPGAVADIRATYFGLVDRDFSQIAITGDSAGGNLALGLLAYLASEVGVSGAMEQKTGLRRGAFEAVRRHAERALTRPFCSLPRESKCLILGSADTSHRAPDRCHLATSMRRAPGMPLRTMPHHKEDRTRHREVLAKDAGQGRRLRSCRRQRTLLSCNSIGR